MKVRHIIPALAVSIVLVSCGSGSSSSKVADALPTGATMVPTSVAPSSGTDFCKDAAYATGAVKDVFSNEKATGAEAKASWEQAQKLLTAMFENAPSEIAKDGQLMVSTINGYIEVLAKYDYDFTKLGADKTAAAEIQKLGDNKAAQTASDNVNKYLESQCGIPMGS